MATVDELVRQYETDPELQREVDAILEDGKITIGEFKAFAKNHDLEVYRINIMLLAILRSHRSCITMVSDTK